VGEALRELVRFVRVQRRRITDDGPDAEGTHEAIMRLALARHAV
jgi:hypothetical protein